MVDHLEKRKIKVFINDYLSKRVRLIRCNGSRSIAPVPKDRL